MVNELITAVVPVYNMGEYLPRAIECLLKQTYCNYEILLIDDGSTDGSGKICDEYAQRYSNIKVVHKENGGLSSARNAAIGNANGKYIIFPDPDDWTEKEYLQTLWNLHQKYNSDLEICGHYISSAKGNVVHNKNASESTFSKEEALSVLMGPFGFCGFAWNKLYHMDIIRDNKLFFDVELGMAQDLHFAFRYICCCEKIAYNPVPMYYYYQHAGGVTNAKMPLTTRKVSGLKTYYKIAELAKEKYPKIEMAAYGTIFNMSMHFTYIYYDSHMQDKALLKQLCDNMRKYREFFFASSIYSFSHKLLGRIVLLWPRAYYVVKKIKSYV